MSGTVLVVDDDADVGSMLRDVLKKHGYAATDVRSAAECLSAMQTAPADVVILDINMVGMSGIELCHELKQKYPDALPIVLTGRVDVATAVEAIRAGAYDYITKPVKVDAMLLALARAMEHLHLHREVKQLRARRETPATPSAGMVGHSDAIRRTIAMIERVANGDTTVLITGESGTGKELVARMLHQRSERANEPFVAVNCAAMPAPLLESELFGHVRGAFTDARRDRSGLFVQAGKGTIFLDEIGEMPLEMQVKLLRVLQERSVRPVGGDKEVPVEARILTATNRNLEDEIAAKRFREDLYYRINVVAIEVPALRERGRDVLLLAQHFIDQMATQMNKPVRGLTPSAARLLVQYDWPGNVRELENCVARAVALCRLDEITIDDLPEKLQQSRPGTTLVAESPTELLPLHQMHLRYVRQVLDAVNGNKSRAAKLLGIDRRSLYRRLEEMNAATAPSEPSETVPASPTTPTATPVSAASEQVSAA